MTALAALLLALPLAVPAPLRVSNQELAASKPHAAEVVTLARLAAVLCPEVDVDEAAVHTLMDRVGITDRDIVDPGAFGLNDTTVARSFVQSFMSAPKEACSTLYQAFGEGAGQLLRPGKPI